MRCDTTAPATRNEWKSLVVMMGTLVVAAGVIWLVVVLVGRVNVGTAGATTLPHAKGSVDRNSETSATVHGGDVYVTIYSRGNEMQVRRATPPERGELQGDWYFARSLLRVLNNPDAARMYGVTEAVPALKALNIQVPSLTSQQQSKISELFLQAQDMEGEARKVADQALVDAVATVGISAEDQAGFDAAMKKVRAILTPEEYEFIRSGRRPAATRPRAATRGSK